MPAVVLMTTSTSLARSRRTTSRYSATSRDPAPVLGSRTCTCTTAAPARAASMPDSAICSGRDRHVLGLADGVPGTGQRAGDDDLAIHCLSFQPTAGELLSSRFV